MTWSRRSSRRINLSHWSYRGFLPEKTRTVLSLNGKYTHHTDPNAIQIEEGGLVEATVMNKPPVKMKAIDVRRAIFSASRLLENVLVHNPSSGVCNYTFQLPVDSQGTMGDGRWAMNDEWAPAFSAVQQVIQRIPQSTWLPRRRSWTGCLQT